MEIQTDGDTYGWRYRWRHIQMEIRMEIHTDGDTYGYIYTSISSDNNIRVGINKKTKKEWFHPGSIRGPSPRQDDVITNYTMKPFKDCEKVFKLFFFLFFFIF